MGRKINLLFFLAMFLVGSYFLFSTDLEKEDRAGASAPVLVEAGYKSHNIVSFKGSYFGVNQAEGPIHMKDLETKAQLKWFKGPSIEIIKAKIDALPQPKVEEQPKAKKVSNEVPVHVSSPPVLVESDYKGFNIVKYNRMFYGVHRAEGPIDVWEIKEKAKLPWFLDSSLNLVKGKITEYDKTLPKPSFMARVQKKINALFE